MNSVTTEKFRKCFDSLPNYVQDSARKSYKIWRLNPSHPSLHFKQIHQTKPIFSVRIGNSWRAIGTKENEIMIWFWIGSHEVYNNLINYF